MDGVDLSYPYIDDILCYSKAWESHLQQFKNFLTCMRDIGLRLKLPKCMFAAPAVKCVGYIVNEQGVTTNPEGGAAILELSRPRNVKVVRSFFGMVASMHGSFLSLHALRHRYMPWPTRGRHLSGVQVVKRPFSLSKLPWPLSQS